MPPRTTTARALRLLADLPEITHFVAGLGTTGNPDGRRPLSAREGVPDVQIVAAEPRYGEGVYALRNIDRGVRPRAVRPGRADDALLRRARSTPSGAPASWFRSRASSPASRPARYCTPRSAWQPRPSKAGERADIAFVVCDAGWKYLSTGAYAGSLDDAEDALEGTAVGVSESGFIDENRGGSPMSLAPTPAKRERPDLGGRRHHHRRVHHAALRHRGVGRSSPPGTRRRRDSAVDGRRTLGHSLGAASARQLGTPQWQCRFRARARLPDDVDRDGDGSSTRRRSCGCSAASAPG